MKYLLPSPKRNRSVNETALRALQRACVLFGQETHSETFTHVQPHAHATASLAKRFAPYCGCSVKSKMPTLEEIVISAHLHDFGKYFISPSILLKPGALNEDEKAAMSLHPIFGSIIVAKLSDATHAVLRAVLHHHEHWDGTGYPEGLSGTSIPIEARIISVLDVYTALRSRRTYKRTFTKEEALGLLIGMAGRELDPNVVEDFLKWVRGR